MCRAPNRDLESPASRLGPRSWFAGWVHSSLPILIYRSLTTSSAYQHARKGESKSRWTRRAEDIFNEQASEAFYEQFGSDIDDMYQRAESDPRIADMETNWSDCMSEEGYEFANQMEPYNFILRRLEEVGAIDGLEVDPEGFVMGYGSQSIEPGTDLYKATEAVLEEEIVIAKASFACSEGAQDVFQEVFQEYEQEFIEENRAALEQFRDENG